MFSINLRSIHYLNICIHMIHIHSLWIRNVLGKRKMTLLRTIHLQVRKYSYMVIAGAPFTTPVKRLVLCQDQDGESNHKAT